MQMSPNTERYTRIQIVDSHTGGEPTRVVIDGGPDLGLGSMAERRLVLQSRFDEFQSAVVNEPRGSDVIVGAILCKPVDPDCVAGVIFFNNVGPLWMCGHGTIGVGVTLGHLGRITAGTHRLETAVGPVTIEYDGENRVSLENVPSYRYARDVVVDVEGLGRITGDIAWGGNWFFLVDSRQLSSVMRQQNVRPQDSFNPEPSATAKRYTQPTDRPGVNKDALRDDARQIELPFSTADIERLTEMTWRIRQALVRSGITGADGGEIDHIELFGPPGDSRHGSRNFVLCPGRAYDRSPCGTGTSAKLACLFADGKLKPGEVWRQESILGSVFEGSVRLEGDKIIPRISGTAYITAESTLLVDPADPFRMGIRAESP